MVHQPDPQAAYDRVVEQLTSDGAQTSAMFGMPCLKIGGKAFAGYFHGDMVFKLRGAEHQRALSLPDAHLFDPSARGRPMKEWVQVPPAAADEWLALGQSAMQTIGQAP